MRFAAEGTFKVVVTDAMLAEPKFCKDPGAFDVCLKVQDAEGHEDWWHGEVSGEWGRGNFSDQTQAQITCKNLSKLGYQHGADFTKIDELVGTETTATIKQSDCGKYFNVSFLGGGGSDPVPLSKSSLAERVAAAAAFFPEGAAPVQAKAAAPAAKAVPKMPNPGKPVAPAAAPVAGAKKPNPFAM